MDVRSARPLKAIKNHEHIFPVVSRVPVDSPMLSESRQLP